MTGSEFVLKFKEDSMMTEQEWRRFCKRYRNKDVSSVVDAIKSLYKKSNVIVPHSLRQALIIEIENQCRAEN